MDFVAIDVETTGILPYVDRIVELAAVRFSGGEVKEEFSSLINPGIRMPQEASLVNQITDEMLEGKPPIEDVLQDFSDFCGSAPLVAHNALFDFQFLSVVLEKHYKAPPTGVVLDTYMLSKKMFAGLSNYKLSTVSSYLRIPTSQFHRAKEDALCCGYVFYAILQKMKNQRQPTHPAHLIELSGKKELRFPHLKARQFSFF